MADTKSTRTGTRSIERAIEMLVEISARNRFGWRATDLAKHCGLDRGTAQRMLGCLVRARLLQRRADRHYLPGPLLFELGLALPAYEAFRAACQPHLVNLARRLSAYVPLCVRSGADSLCIAAAGPSTYRGVVFDVGTRRPLTATAAGVAILLALPSEEKRHILSLQHRQPSMGGDPELAASLRMWRKSLSLGYGLNQGYTARGIHAVGIPVLDADGSPFGSLTVATAAARMPASKIPGTVATLREAAALLSGLARETLPDGRYNGGEIKQARR